MLFTILFREAFPLDIKAKFEKGVFQIVRGLVKFFYPKTQIAGLENLPSEPALIAGNHSQMNGPIICELYFPGQSYTWCAGQMMHLKEVPEYAFQDFWAQKPKYIRWFYKGLSYIIAPLSVCIFKHAKTIGVYRDGRIISTFKNTIRRLDEGAHVIIFPEHNTPHNHILCDFQDKFIDCAKLYYKRTGKALSFVPMYIAPNLHKAFLGKPIQFRPDAPIEEERQRLCDYLMEQITDMALAQPRHKVVPYRNIPRKQYPYNIPIEVTPDRENSCR